MFWIGHVSRRLSTTLSSQKDKLFFRFISSSWKSHSVHQYHVMVTAHHRYFTCAFHKTNLCNWNIVVAGLEPSNPAGTAHTVKWCKNSLKAAKYIGFEVGSRGSTFCRVCLWFFWYVQSVSNQRKAVKPTITEDLAASECILVTPHWNVNFFFSFSLIEGLC